MSDRGERPTASRRKLLAAAGAVGTTLIAGCNDVLPGGDGGDQTDTPGTDSPTSTPTQTRTETQTQTETETQTPTETDATESPANETADGGQGGTRRLTVGQTFQAPTGVSATVERVEVRQSGEGPGNDSNVTAPGGQQPTVPPGQQAVAVEFSATNGSDAGASAPDPSSITLRAGGRAFGPRGVGRIPDGYTGGELAAGESTSGWLLYLIPSGIPRSNLSVAWNGRGAGQSWTAVWTEV